MTRLSSSGQASKRSSAAVRTPGLKRLGLAMLSLATAAVLLLVVSLAVLLEAGYAGITQRVIFLLSYAWALLAASARARADLRPLRVDR